MNVRFSRRCLEASVAGAERASERVRKWGWRGSRRQEHAGPCMLWEGVWAASEVRLEAAVRSSKGSAPGGRRALSEGRVG